MSTGAFFDPQMTDPHLNELAAAAGFTLDDVRANRKRSLTPRQITLLRMDQRRQYWPSLIAWSILGALIIILALMHWELAADWMAVLVGVMVLGGLSAYELRLTRQSIGDDAGEVAHAAFCADATWKPRRRLSMLEFQIGPRWFAMPRRVAPVLRDGQRYRIYYAAEIWSYPPGGGTRMKPTPGGSSPAGSYRVLSIEPVTSHEAES